MNNNSLRLARVLTMLPWLLNNKSVSVQEVSRIFSISEKEVLSDLALLTFVGPDQAGGGLVDIQYDSNRIQVIDPQGLEHALSLNVFEMMSLTLGLKILQDLDLANSATFSAMEKLEKILSVKEPLEFKSNNIKQAMVDKKLLQIEYLSFGGAQAQNRIIEPGQIIVKKGVMYLLAYCHNSNDWRTFRVDRILDSQVLDQSFEPKKVIEIESDESQIAHLVLEKGAKWILDEYRVDIEKVGTKDLKVELKVHSNSWFFPFLVSVSGQLKEGKLSEDLKRAVISEINTNISRLNADS